VLKQRTALNTPSVFSKKTIARLNEKMLLHFSCLQFIANGEAFAAHSDAVI
jgi:hypothetical protein